MTFLAPGFLFAAFAVAAAIVALHFIVTRQPRSSILPTTRFVPDTRATTIAPAQRPSDLPVMLLRVLMVLAAGAALARPVFRPERQPTARVLLIDVSRSATDSIAARDSGRANYRQGDAVVLFDSAARLLAGNVSDTLAQLVPTSRRGNLSAALISALRAASSIRDRADSLELVIISPFAREELNAATDSIRGLWPGKARLVRGGLGVSQSERALVPGKIDVSADSDDPVAVTAGMVRPDDGSNALIDRAPLRGASPSNGAATSGSSPVTVGGGALIDWPATRRPRGTVARTIVDTTGGLTTTDERVVAPFERRWLFPPDSLRGAEVIARWADGEPAAIERSVDAGCLRSVAIPVAGAGDLAIRQEFVRFVRSLSQPCARFSATIPADPSAVARLAGTGGLAPRAAFASPGDTRSTLAPWLLALAILAAVGELFVRNRMRNATVASAVSSAEARAA